MQPLNRPKHVTAKPIVDLTTQSPSAPINTSSILSGAFHALNNVTNNNTKPSNPNPNIRTNFNINHNTFYNRNKPHPPRLSPQRTTPNTNSIQSIPQGLPPTINKPPFIIQNTPKQNHNIIRIKPEPKPEPKPIPNTKTGPTHTSPFTSGIVDVVSFNYDANRLKNSEYHTIFDDEWSDKINLMIVNDTLNNNTSKIKSSPLDPYKVLNAPRIKFESQITNDHEDVLNYADYNLFREDDKKQCVIYKLFHPSYAHGIKDTHLFNYISRNILQLQCVGDIGIDLLNFLHSLFIILYWNDRYFKLQLNETPMHGIIKMLQALVPLQTCVWWLNLHHSLNMINEKAELPNIDFKNILNKQTEKNVFYSNLIKRLMSSGEQQANTWKDYLLHSRNNLKQFLFDEKRRRLTQITHHDGIVPFNKQLKNYIEQLLLPKLILRVWGISDRLQNILTHSNSLSERCLKSRQYLTKDGASYFSDHDIRDEDTDDDDDVILMGDNTKDDTSTCPDGSSTPKASSVQPRSFLMNQDERVQISYNKYEELQKQAKKDRHRNNKKKRKHRHRHRHRHRKRRKHRQTESDEDTITCTESMEQTEEDENTEDMNILSDPTGTIRKRKRKRDDLDPDFDPNEKEKVETRGRKKKKINVLNEGEPRNKRRKKHSVRYSDVLMDADEKDKEEEEEDIDKMELSKDGRIYIDFRRKHIDNFLKCGICHKCLGTSILTINECMDSFCEQCLDGYFAKCVKDNIMAKCPKCDRDLGQGSVSSIWQKICKEDKMKMSLIELITGAKTSENLE